MSDAASDRARRGPRRRGRDRSQPRPSERPQRLPGARRRHRLEPGRDRARARRRPRVGDRGRRRGGRGRRQARGADGRERQQRRHPVPDRRRASPTSSARRRALDSPTLARALRSASDAAYRPVRQPIEGTMLTVIREMAETAEAQAGDGPRRGHRRGARGRGRERRAHAVDARRCCARRAWSMPAPPAWSSSAAAPSPGARGEHIHAPLESIERPLSIEAVHQEESQYRYCTSFLLEGDGDRPRPARAPAGRDGRLPARGRRGADVPRARAHRRSRRRPHPRGRDGQHRPCLDREHAGADPPARAAADGRAKARRLPGGRADEAPLTAENTAIVLDSTADLPHPEREHPNWRMVPLIVRFGERAVRRRRRHASPRLLRRLRRRRPAPADRGAAARRLLADVRAPERLRPRLRAAGLLEGVRQRQAAQIAADDPSAAAASRCSTGSRSAWHGDARRRRAAAARGGHAP